jgi:hypothetical protein
LALRRLRTLIAVLSVGARGTSTPVRELLARLPADPP